MAVLRIGPVFWRKAYSYFHISLFLGFLQSEDFTEERIRFGVESVYIDSWMRRRIYDAFKEIMESGVRHHLQVRVTHGDLLFPRIKCREF